MWVVFSIHSWFLCREIEECLWLDTACIGEFVNVLHILCIPPPCLSVCGCILDECGLAGSPLLSSFTCSGKDPVRAPGHNVPLIHLLISVLYVLFACLHHLLPTYPFFFTFFLTYLLPYLSFPLRIDPLRFQARCHKGTVRHCQSKEASILWSYHEETRELPGERNNARNNAMCMQARKTTHSLDRQHQDVDRTPCGRVKQNDRG